MISLRFKIWYFCLAVAVSALVLKLVMVLPVLISLTAPLILLGPIAGIVLDRYRGGTGISGGCIAGIISGFAIAAIMCLCVHYPGRPNAWRDFAYLSAGFSIVEAFHGWFWGHSSQKFYLSFAVQTAADKKGWGAEEATEIISNKIAHQAIDSKIISVASSAPHRKG